MSVNTNLVELLNYESPYTIDGGHSTGMLARFKVGQSYGVNDNNLKSNGVQLAFTVNKNTHKSVNITVYEKYNGVVTVKENVRKNLNCGGYGFWVTVDGVKYATVELFDGSSLSRWVKGHINVLNTKEVDLNDFTSCDNVPNVPNVLNAEKVEKVLDFTPVFYAIDEKIARLAREMNSFREYEENSTTEHYKARVKEVFEIAEKNQSEKSLYLANIYAKKYAEYINNSNRVDCLCPSIMISGGGNFNVRKKEKQNARRDNLMKDYEKLQNLLEKIERPAGWGYAEIKRDTITANEFDGVQFFKVVTNEEVNRLQLVDFEEIPSEEQKTILKKNGFKWSPRFQAWQRQLTENAINGVWRVVREFERLENEEIEELHATIQENKPVENTEPVQELEKPEPVAETPEPAQAQEVEPVEEIKLECVKSVVIDFKRNEEIQQVEPEPAPEVENAEQGQKVDYVSKIKDITNKFDKCIDNLDEKRLMTIYVMLTQFSGNAWVKDDKARIYINNGFEFVETEKLELIKPNVWVGKNKFDWYKWEVNGLQTYEVFKHSKDDKAYCCKLSNEFIELNLYYDVINNKFVFEDDIFNVTKTVIEKIKSDVKDIKLLPVQEVPKAEPVHITIDNTPDLVKSVIELEKVKKSDNVISEKSKEFLKEFNALSKDIIENTVDNVMKTIEKTEPIEKDFKIEFEIMYKSKSTRFDTRYSLQSTKVGVRLVNNIVKHGDIRLYGHIYENGVFDEDVYADIKCTLVNEEEEDYMITSDGLSYECCITELQKALQEAIDNMKIKLTKDTELKRYMIEHDYKLYDGVSQSVYCKAPSEEVKKVGLDINTSYPEPVQIDINTSYPELQCFEDIEKVEENTVFKVGCFYTGSDKSLYLVTKRGLNTIDLMSISKGFKEYDIPIVTDIYDNEYTTISYSNSISVISSIDIKYTEKNFKRTLYDFVNNNFYGNDVYGKYDVEDVERVLNMLYGKIID